MSDDAQETSNDVAPSTPASPSAVGSIVRLLGIAVGLTAIAALGVGVVFWKTLNDASNQGTSVIEVDPNEADVDDNAYAAQGEGGSPGGGPSGDEGPSDDDSGNDGSSAGGPTRGPAGGLGGPTDSSSYDPSLRPAAEKSGDTDSAGGDSAESEAPEGSGTEPNPSE